MEIPVSLLAIFAVISSVIANVFSKRASENLVVWTDFLSVDIFLCLFFYAVGTTTYILLLRKVPISTAYPLFSCTFVLVILVGRFFFNEHISLLKLIGIFVVLIGITLITVGSNRPV